MSELRLSEAIRLGAMLKPQGSGAFYSLRNGGTCALGSALDAVGRLNVDDPCDCKQPAFISKTWPLMNAMGQTCPECHVVMGTRFWVIAHLNDQHKWTREQIADLIETIEQAQSQHSPDPASIVTA